MHLWRHSVCGRPHCCRSHSTTSDRHTSTSAGKPLQRRRRQGEALKWWTTEIHNWLQIEGIDGWGGRKWCSMKSIAISQNFSLPISLLLYKTYFLSWLPRWPSGWPMTIPSQGWVLTDYEMHTNILYGNKCAVDRSLCDDTFTFLDPVVHHFKILERKKGFRDKTW